MLAYQEEYIANCRSFRELTTLPKLDGATFDADFAEAMEKMREAGKLAARNTALLTENLLPALDSLYDQSPETLEELERFADALTAGAQSLDVALALQIHVALLSAARRSGDREYVIRELYKQGMVRYQLWDMLTGISAEEKEGYSLRMRYCFVEAAGYLKYFDEFGRETKGYILRSLANIYLGEYQDWRDKLACVRRSMQVFTDERYRAAAPHLPWDRFMDALNKQIVSVVPFSFPEGTLSADAVEDVMEAAHEIYEVHMEKWSKGERNFDAHRIMPYYSLEYACGFITREELIDHMEELMDAADITRYDDAGTYQIVSMPAFYVQYLRQMPDMLPPREDYIAQLYDRVVEYVENTPPEGLADHAKLYLRQLLTVYQDVEGGVSYRDMCLFLITRIAPDVYAHGYAVGKMAQVLCEALLGDDPTYLDDIPEIAALPNGPEKTRAALDLALGAGVLHDVGKLSFTALYRHAGRQMLQAEEEALRFHTVVGCQRLADHASTRLYADAALGHHSWYDGSDGFPRRYRRQESPVRALVDVISFADYLEAEGDDDTSLPIRRTTFEEKIANAIKLEGRRFSPMVTAWLRAPEVLEKLKDLYLNGRRQGYTYCCLAMEPGRMPKRGKKEDGARR